jgi:hypothetical protein
MNEDHIIAAILAAGLLASSKDANLQPDDAVRTYELTLAELLSATRATRPDENA